MNTDLFTKFNQFLLKHGIKRAWTRNMREYDQSRISVKEYVDKFYGNANGSSLLGGAFWWDETDEGQNYWSGYKELWVKEVESWDT